MKKYEENMKKYEGNMKTYEENMKKYEGITLPIYRPWDLEKFQVHPATREGGLQNTSWEGRRDQRHGTCQL